MRRALGPAAIAAALALGSAAPAAAEPGRDLGFTTAVDLPVTGALASFWLVSELGLKSRLAPAAPRWTEPSQADRNARDSLRWNNPAFADQLSDLDAFVATPLWTLVAAGALAGTHDDGAEVAQNLTLILESMTAAMTLNQIAKFAAGRQRPCARFNEARESNPCHFNKNDENLSWFSGHSAYTASLGVSSGMVATLRGYRAAPAVWAGGALLSLSTAYLRVAADKHYLSDVVTGLVVGSAVGILVPLAFHGPTSLGASAAASSPLRSASPATIGFSGVW